MSIDEQSTDVFPRLNQCQGQGRHGEVAIVPGSYAHGPFSGDVIEYAFLEISAKLDMSKKLEQWPSTPIEKREYGHLYAKYEGGYRLLSFLALPVWDFYKLTFDRDNPLHIHKYSKFQGIFRKKIPSEADEKWRLMVKTCILTNQLFYSWRDGKSDSNFKRVSDCRHILQTINQISQDHGRLVGLEMVDFGAQQFEIEQYKAWTQPICEGELRQTEVEVDIFYEVPLHSGSEKYIYQAVDCQIHASMEDMRHSGDLQGWRVTTCHLKDTFDKFLGSGWKLVDVFCNNAAEEKIQFTGSKERFLLTQNFLWIFEKPQSRENDATPYYEITMVEHWLRVPERGKGYKGALENLDDDWTKVITNMGQSGWEVAGIVQTPETSVQGGLIGGYRYWTKMLLFFQRSIQPPSYDSLFS